MAQRLSQNQKNELKELFISGISVEELAEKFDCTKLTITRNLKKKIGDDAYKILKKKNDLNPKKEENKSFEDKLNYNNSFVEIAPLNFNHDFSKQKELTSKSLEEISLPKTVFMIVDKKIELDVKLLKDYAEWQFLPEDDLNRKTIRIFFDIKKAKGLCNKDNKVIKVPNTNVFKLTSNFLISKGITRIVCEDELISL